MSDPTLSSDGETYRYVDDVAPGSADHRLFMVLHATQLPREIFHTDDREEQLAQVRWLLEHGQTLQSWSLTQHYWDEQAPLGTFVRKMAPDQQIEIANTMQANPITRVVPGGRLG